MIGGTFPPEYGEGDRYGEAHHTQYAHHSEGEWRGPMEGGPKPHDDDQCSIGGAKPAEQPVQTDMAQADQGGLRDHQQHPAVKDRAMHAEQDHVSNWALGMQQTGSDGITEAVGN